MFDHGVHVIVLPGGGYEYLADHEGQVVVDWLRGLGYGASVLRYPVRVQHPEPLRAVRARIARLRAAGTERVILLGFSAGGHLAGLAALSPAGTPADAVDAAVLCYPVVSMRVDEHEGSRLNLLGEAPSEERRRTLSLEELVRPGSVPIFIWHTAADDLVPVQHSYRLSSRLASAKVEHELHVFSKGGHGLGLAEASEAAEWLTLCARWLSSLTSQWAAQRSAHPDQRLHSRSAHQSKAIPA